MSQKRHTDQQVPRTLFRRHDEHVRGVSRAEHQRSREPPGHFRGFAGHLRLDQAAKHRFFADRDVAEKPYADRASERVTHAAVEGATEQVGILYPRLRYPRSPSIKSEAPMPAGTVARIPSQTSSSAKTPG